VRLTSHRSAAPPSAAYRPADRGSVAAELAAAMPAAILVLVLCTGALQSLARQAILADVAAQSARSLARGGSAPPLPEGAALTEERVGGSVCVSVRLAAGPLGLPLTGRACALDGGL
jgi:hypothetical protein